MNRLIIPVFAAGVALLSIPAAAQEQMSVPVNYSDLNISSPQGAVRFHQRLEKAVEQICGAELPRDLTQKSVVKACRLEVWRSATIEENKAIAAAGQHTFLASNVKSNLATQ